MDHNSEPQIHGIMAEFETPTAAVEAAKKIYEQGYRHLDAFAPYPLEELSDAIGFRKNRMSLIVLCGGIIGGLAGFGLQIWTSAYDYPLNVGGKPYISLPSFIPPAYEMTILFAAFSGVIGMILANGLPRPYHPVFNVERFAKYASSDRFFVLIEATDPKFNRAETQQFMATLGAYEVNEVEE